MDPVQELVARFKLLRTNSARRAAYHQIIDQLGPHEWRDAKKRINGRSFQKDILGELPLELSVAIVQYLTLRELHLLRRVSRRWSNVLSSELVCNAVFRQYTGGPLKVGDEYKSTFARYSKHRYLLEQGTPLTRAQLSLPLEPGPAISNLDYSNGRYAWTIDHDTTIITYDLRSQRTQRFCTPNRERFEKIRLSESVLAAITTRGYCQAWDLQTEEMHTIRLPNTNISLFVLNGFQIAMCSQATWVKNSCMHSEGSFVMHYDLRTRSTHTIPNAQSPAYVGLGSSMKHLTIVQLELGNNTKRDIMPGCPHLRVMKYVLHLNGESSAVRTYTKELPLPGDHEGTDVRVRHDLDGSGNRIGILQAGRHLVLAVTYDPQTDEICVHRLSDIEASNPLCIVHVGGNILYYIKIEEGRRNIWISNPYIETALYAAQSMDLGLPRDAREGASLFTDAYRFLVGDSSFVSLIDARGIRLWSFAGTNYPEEVSVPTQS
ncbi:hypothetical protein BJX61DRAFT_352443 [Aspergillus egyptiacus]|nr:hypothetical protein BJX61DRAFT_352443 [Aspergillus egyptiacus]